MKMWSAVLTVWIWCISIQSHEIWSLTRDPLIADLQVKAPSYKKVPFNAGKADSETYGAMIKSLRDLLVSGSYIRGIPVLQESVSDDQRYVLLEITETRGRSVTFAIDVTNVYVVGYRVGNQRYFFEEAPANAADFLFTDITAPLPQRRSSNYNSLEARAGQRRTNIPLGLQNLDAAITTLLSRPEDPRSLLIVIQMVSEAVRYWEIESRVRRHADLGTAFQPDQYMVDLETNWGALSEQVQRSDFLAFERAITIGDRVADNVNSYVIAGMFLMLFVCNPAASTSFVSHLQLVKPYLVEDTCNHLVEPRTRIRGRNGLCVDVENFNYRDNNSIVLYTCKNRDFKNQLWTLRTNGRIESLEKCLAASGSTAGSSVMIHECDTLDESAIRWVMLYSGTLVNVHSGLVLTATQGSDGSKLTLEKDSNSSFQAWKTTSNLTVVDVYIHGEKNQCIYYNGKYGVYTETCSKGSSRQQWRLYPDSTIRPKDWLDGCLEIASLSGSSIYVQAGYCSESPELHRWIFAHDGSIMNWQSKKVVDASKTYPGYLYAWPFHGGSNQIWTLDFI